MRPMNVAYTLTFFLASWKSVWYSSIVYFDTQCHSRTQNTAQAIIFAFNCVISDARRYLAFGLFHLRKQPRRCYNSELGRADVPCGSGIPGRAHSRLRQKGSRSRLVYKPSGPPVYLNFLYTSLTVAKGWGRGHPDFSDWSRGDWEMPRGTRRLVADVS